MKALILHQHFNTPEKGGALRSYFLAKALVDHGIKTAIITTHNSAYSKVNYEGIEVHSLPISYSNDFGFYKRIWSYLSFMVRAAVLSVRIKNVTACYAMSTPLTTGLTGVFVKWIKGVPLFFETGDLWPDAPIQLGFIKNPLLKILLRGAERFIYWQSTKLVALSSSMKAILEKRTHRPVHLIPNMADADFYKPVAKRDDLVRKYDVGGNFVISYIGSMGYANGLEYVLDCARAVQKAKLPVLFLFCGEGAVLSYLKSTVDKLGIDNVRFIGFQNRNGVREIMNITDAVFISYRQHPVLETGSPNKYFDALAAGKLIITNFGGWIEEEIVKTGSGFRVSHDRPQEIVNPLKSLLDKPSTLHVAQSNSYKLSGKYSRAQVSKDFVALFDV